jgi:hypothetical protein
MSRQSLAAFCMESAKGERAVLWHISLMANLRFRRQAFERRIAAENDFCRSKDRLIRLAANRINSR